MRARRRPFTDLVERQLDLFASDCAGLLEAMTVALGTYDAAPAGEAEERYGEFADLVDTTRDELEELRETYAATLDGRAAAEYRDAFDRLARKRFPDLALVE